LLAAAAAAGANEISGVGSLRRALQESEGMKGHTPGYSPSEQQTQLRDSETEGLFVISSALSACGLARYYQYTVVGFRFDKSSLHTWDCGSML
jgi:hypothetical protein